MKKSMPRATPMPSQWNTWRVIITRLCPSSSSARSQAVPTQSRPKTGTREIQYVAAKEELVVVRATPSMASITMTVATIMATVHERSTEKSRCKCRGCSWGAGGLAGPALVEGIVALVGLVVMVVSILSLNDPGRCDREFLPSDAETQLCVFFS